MKSIQTVTNTNKRRTVLGGLVALATSGLIACSPKEASQQDASLTPAKAFEIVAKEGKGFTVGSMMTANTVYVMFDPQCPHCGHLWEQSIPLQTKVKFVWMPVAFINSKSAPQGAALLAAANPAEAMAAHEASILAGTGGTAASSSIPDDVDSAIQHNTALFNRMGADSVPQIIAKNQTTGEVVTHTGALETDALRQFLGMN
jgi:thiol:disulfide interchange protein DsbG